MKWPKGPLGVVLGVGAAVLVCAVAWAVVATVTGGDDVAVEVPAGLPDAASGQASGSVDASGTLGGDGSQLATDAADGDAAAGAGSGTAAGGGTAPSTAPAGTGKTAFTEEQAREFVAAFLTNLQQNREADARAMASPAFAASVGPAFFDRTGDPLGTVEVILATRENARWNVYCGEVWRSGPRQTRYGLTERGGKLYIESFEIADLP